MTSFANEYGKKDELKLSVVITTYDLNRYDDFQECVSEVIQQEYHSLEIILVSETDIVRKKIQEDFVHQNCVKHIHMNNGKNLATARNTGAKSATGDIVVFIDDDAVPEENWLSEIERGYKESSALGVGGQSLPLWVNSEVSWLPEEFYWLVGVTHRGFETEEKEVRNTFGCNISFVREVFLSLGGFDTEFGKDHGHNLQGEESEFCVRLQEVTGNGIYYVPTAKIRHKVYSEQTEFTWLIDRAFWQGVTKRFMRNKHKNSTGTEVSYVEFLLLQAMPNYISDIFSGKNFVLKIHKLIIFILLSLSTAFGFFFGGIYNKRL